MHFLLGAMQNNNTAGWHGLLNDNFVTANISKHFAGLFV